MMCFLPAILFMFAGIVINAADDQGIIKGRVYDRQTLGPLPGATVVYGRDRGVSTGPDGSFSLEIDPGNITLTFRYIGYKSVIRAVNVLPADTVILDIGMEYDVSEIDQVVVSAGKTEQRLAELTVSVNIIRPAALEAAHIADASELINKSPGIEVIDGQASIRGGSGFSYGAGSRVLALVDGLPVLSADAGNIKWQFLPLENISQIEIIKGASSVMYGSSALNGVINFRTSDAGVNPVTKFYLETGVFGRPQQPDWIWWDTPRTFSSTSFSHNQKSGNTDIGVALHLMSDEGYRKFNEERLGRLNLKMRHHDRKVEGLSYGMNINAGITRKTDFVLWEDAWTGALKQDESTARELHGNLITVDPYISLKKRDKSSHDLRTRLQSSENRFREAVQNNSRALSFYAEYQFRHAINDFIDLNFGVLENYSRIHSPLYGNHNALNIAGYTQADIALVGRLKLVTGVRLEHNSLNGINDKLIPLLRAGINYRLMNYTFLRASFGQGYRYPSIAERHAATTLGSVRIVANPDIRSESGWTTEIGIKQGLLAGNIQGQIDLALFYSRYTDMIEFLFGVYPVPGEDIFSYGFMAANVEQSRVYGGEFEFSISGQSGRFHNVMNGGYVFTYPVEVNALTGKNKDEYLKYRRKHSVKLNLSSSRGRLDFGIGLQAGSAILNIDKVFLNNLTRETILPGFYDYWNDSGNRGYIVIDPQMGFSITGKFKLSVVVKNALNREYMGRPGDIMPHRNYSIRFSGTL
jgi:outer membrane cobalamin receptor